MRTVKLAASLTAALLMQACGGPTAAEQSQLITGAAALTSAVSRGCTFTLSYRVVGPPFPPTYVPVLTRQASSTCPWGAASVDLGAPYSVPELSLVANDLGVAVGYTNRYSPSGSSGTRLELRHVAPDTLSVVRSVTLAAYVSPGTSYISTTEMSILTDGTTLKVKGEKSGVIPGEAGSGSYFSATFPDFFTSTTTPTLTASTAPEVTSVGSWSVTGGLASARSVHTATLLNGTGDVLVVSGTSAEVFNPYSNTSTLTGAPIYERKQHTATAISSSQVLVAGGWIGSAPLYWRRTAEVYDQATGTWTATDTMSTPRGNHTATLLDSGKVLVVGGTSTDGATNTAELFDPSTNTWSPAASAPTATYRHTATLLYSGKVLVTGGETYGTGALSTVQEYDPATNTWSLMSSMPRSRTGHVAVRLYSGTVMVLGGGRDEVDLYNPYMATPWWSPGPTLPSGASAVSATLLYSGEVLVTHSTGQASLYDPSTNAWQSAGVLTAPLYSHAVTFLHSGQVLVTGGYTSGTDVTTAQRYTR